ncbi:MAG TPA: kelch repeat-containing protein [Bacteroidia bacterium]|nr:kelch repeat-containing protein [Bacteroidia bacterium]
MKKIILLGFALLIADFSNAQAPDSWTEKNAIGLNVTTSTFMSQRYGAVGFSIGTKGYVGTGMDGNYKNDFWEYDPVLNVWTQKSDFGGIGTYFATGFSIGNKGYIGTGVYTGKDFWEYDPSTNIWIQKADFGGAGRRGAAGFSIGNKGYIGTGGGLNDFWEYDLAADTWIQKANFPGAGRNYAAGFSISGRGYIGTGYHSAAPYFNDFWEYDPATDTWTQKANFAAFCEGATGFSIGNKGYMGTGYPLTGGGANHFWEYDPSTNIWTQKANLDIYPREWAISFSIGNKGYISAGSRGGTAVNDMWEYDTIANTWTQKNNYGSAARNNAVGFSISGKGYIGTGTSEHFLNYKNDWWEFNPSTNDWIQKANFTGVLRKSAAGFCIADKGYFGTGSHAYPITYYKDFWEFNPSTNSWTQKANFGGTARSEACGFSIGNKGYMGTGIDGSSKNDFWEYDPIINIWIQKSNFGGAARYGAVGFSIGNKGYIGTGGGLNDFWEYDQAMNVWTQKASFSGLNRGDAACFSLGNKGYIGTGWNSSSGYLNDFWEFDPSANTWIQRAAFGGIYRMQAVGFCIGTKGYIGTGSTNGDRNDLWEYTPICSTPVSTIYSSGNTTFCNGDSVFLYANNGYNYQWKKNGVDITGATSYFYYAKTTGNYTCYLTNSCGAVTSSAISVTVNSLPSATITPVGPTTFCSGGSVVLNAPSGANKTYQWKKGANLISGVTSSSYTVTTGGNYRVIVTNTVTGCSKTSNSATVVTVNALPAATITPQGPVTFCAGGSVVLQANTGAGLTYKWKKGSSFISGATLSSYTATTGGNYRVQVTNSNGCSKVSGLVAVSVPCKEGESVTVGEGESVFDVNVYPNPNSGEFTIKFSNKPISSIQIELTDEIGKVINRFETNDETIVIKESNLAKGIYCLTVRNKSEVVKKKISVVK